MFEEKWDEILCQIAMGNFYFTQLADSTGYDNIEGILNEMEKIGLIYFSEVRVCLTQQGAQRIHGKLKQILD